MVWEINHLTPTGRILILSKKAQISLIQLKTGNTLLKKEALHIKLKKPVLNSGLNDLKVCKGFNCLTNLFSRHILMRCYHGFSNCF